MFINMRNIAWQCALLHSPLKTPLYLWWFISLQGGAPPPYIRRAPTCPCLLHAITQMESPLATFVQSNKSRDYGAPAAIPVAQLCSQHRSSAMLLPQPKHNSIWSLVDKRHKAYPFPINDKGHNFVPGLHKISSTGKVIALARPRT